MYLAIDNKKVCIPKLELGNEGKGRESMHSQAGAWERGESMHSQAGAWERGVKLELGNEGWGNKGRESMHYQAGAWERGEAGAWERGTIKYYRYKKTPVKTEVSFK